MRAALFLENDQLCDLDKNIGDKKLKVIIFSIDETRHVYTQCDYLFHQSIGYLSLWILNKQIKKVFVLRVDPDIRLLLSKIGATVKEKDELQNEFFLKDYIF